MKARRQESESSDDNGVGSDGQDDVSVSEDEASSEESGEVFHSDEEESEEESDTRGNDETLSSDEKDAPAGPAGRTGRQQSVNLRKATAGIQRSGPQATVPVKSAPILPATLASKNSSSNSEETSSEAKSAPKHPPSASASEDRVKALVTGPPSAPRARQVAKPSASAGVANQDAVSNSEDDTASEDSTETESTEMGHQADQNATGGQQGSAQNAGAAAPLAVAKHHSWNPFASKKALTAQDLDTKIQKHRARATKAEQQSKTATSRRTENNQAFHDRDTPVGGKIIAFFSKFGRWTSEKRANRKWNSELNKTEQLRKERMALSNGPQQPIQQGGGQKPSRT